MIKNKLFVLFAVMTMVIGMIGGVPVKAAEVSLNFSRKNLYAGSFFQLKLKNSNGNVVWKSSKESVAQVLPSGIVVGIKKGKATITATYNGVAYGCTVTVKNPTIDKTKANMRVDDELRLKMKGNNPVSWSSSNNKVATVDDGGLVTALMVGTATITAKCEDGNEYTSKITVQNYNLKAGDTIKMGHYEQDNNTYNGSELIEWKVLEVKDGKALLLSKNALECKRFCRESYDRQVWDVSEIRNWLNSTFYDYSFSKDEKEKIISSVVTADLNPKDNTLSQGTATQDFIFLLSIKEVEEYEPEKCGLTEYVISQKLGGKDGYCAYFLRTAGWTGQGVSFNCTRVSAVKSDGTIFYALYPDDDFRGEQYSGIRPAMWVTVD